MKKKLIVLTLITTLLMPGLALAQSASPVSSNRAVRQEERMTNLKARADKEIDRRLVTLNKLMDRINANTRLTAADKSSLTSLVQTDVTNLTNLKTKIDADTDLATLRDDVQSVVKDYRVYALVVPKVALVLASDKVLSALDKVSTVSAKLQTKIQAAQTSGKDVTSLQSAYNDIQTKLADAKTQAQTAKDLVMSLTPDGYPGNKATLQQAHQNLKNARLDIVAIRQDAQTIVQGLKAIRSSASSSPAGSQ